MESTCLLTKTMKESPNCNTVVTVAIFKTSVMCLSYNYIACEAVGFGKIRKQDLWLSRPLVWPNMT